MTWGEVKKICAHVPDYAMIKYSLYPDDGKNPEKEEHVACCILVEKYYSSDDETETWTIEIG